MGCFGSTLRGDHHTGDGEGNTREEWNTKGGDLKHRLTSEHSIIHLVRHHRFHPRKGKEDAFGLAGAYDAVKKIASGGTSDVWLFKDRVYDDEGDTVAVKLMERPIPKDSVPMTFNEILVSIELSNSVLMRMKDVLLTPSHFGITMEYAKGGNLAEHVARRVPLVKKKGLVLDEDEARLIFKEIIEAVEYMHSHHVAHRDLKLDNILVVTEKNEPVKIRLADFQFAYHWGKRDSYAKYRGLLGTPVYMSPELLALRFSQDGDSKDERSTSTYENNKYDPVMADVWACGIILVALLVGGFPFDPERPGISMVETERKIFEMQRDMSWSEGEFVKPHIDGLSIECKNLLDGILENNPHKRFSLARIKRDAWMCQPIRDDRQKAWEEFVKEHKEQCEHVEHVSSPILNKRITAIQQLVDQAATQDTPSYSGILLDSGLSSIVDHHTLDNGIRLSLRTEELAVGNGDGNATQSTEYDDLVEEST